MTTLARLLGVLLAVLLVIGVAALWQYDRFLDSPLDVPADGARFEIAAGSSFKRVSQQLAEEGIVSNPTLLRVYARIADRTVADAYDTVTDQIDALYNTANSPGALPAEIETNAMARLRHETHARMLGNGLCTRPGELNCRMETICETCAYYTTDTTFDPVLHAQRDHAAQHDQHHRVDLFQMLIDRNQHATP